LNFSEFRGGVQIDDSELQGVRFSSGTGWIDVFGVSVNDAVQPR
jgi:hypothetical protein